MKYFVSRGDQQFGPYTLAELQQYVSQGNIAMTDLVRSEGMEQWVPVTQVIGNIAVPAAPQQYGMQPQAGAGGTGANPAYPAPSDMSWVLLLVLSIVTCGIFHLVWIFKQASFAKKLNPENKAPVLFAIFLGLYLLGYGLNIANNQEAGIGTLLVLGGWVCYIVGFFKIRGDMLQHYNSVEPIGLQMNPVVTFFFGYLQTQYHFERIAKWKQTGHLPS
jgi:hypothetical protein